MMCHSYLTKWKKWPGLPLVLKNDMMALLIQWRVCLPSPLCSLADSSTKSPVNSYDCYSSSPLWTLSDVSIGSGFSSARVVCHMRILCIMQIHTHSVLFIVCTHTSIICVCLLAYVCTRPTQHTVSISIISGYFCLHTYTCIYTACMDTFSDSDWNYFSGTFTSIS